MQKVLQDKKLITSSLVVVDKAGGGNAVGFNYLNSRPADGHAVLVTPFTSLAATATRRYPFAPDFLLKYPLRTDAIIGAVRSPVLLMAGTQDTLTPLADSITLKSLVRAPVELLVVDGAHHNDIHRFPAYIDGLAERLSSIGDAHSFRAVPVLNPRTNSKPPSGDKQ